jgi:hypothetical protein
MPGSTARGGFRWPLGTGEPPDTDGHMRRLAEDIDASVALDGQGLLADRPVAGVRGRYYYAVDDNGGQLYRDTGTAWVGLLTSSAANADYLAKADNLAALVDKAAARANLGADAAYLLRDEAKNAFTTTSETTTSTTYADLATIGPEVTVNIRDDGSGTGRALFIVGGRLTNNTVGQQCFMSVAGAALPATDSTALAVTAEASSNLLIASHVFIAGGLNVGSRTYTAKYRVSGGTGTFSARRLTVIPL